MTDIEAYNKILSILDRKFWEHAVDTKRLHKECDEMPWFKRIFTNDGDKLLENSSNNVAIMEFIILIQKNIKQEIINAESVNNSKE